jgi:septal ring factor EnvC (AmiA/AmiB activator)
MPFYAVIMLYAFLILLSVPIDSSFAWPASESEIKEDQIRQIETDLSREKEQFIRFGDKERSLLGQLSDLEQKIEERKAFLKKLNEKIRQNKNELRKRNQGLRELEKSLAEVRERVSKRLIVFYKYAKRGYVKILTTSEDLEELRKRVKYLKVILNEDQELLKQAAGIRKKYRKEISLVNERLAVIARMEKAENRQLSSIKRDLDRKVILLMKIHKEKEFYETAVKELQLAARELKEKLLSFGKNLKQNRLLPKGFAKRKGNLPLPFDGKIVKSDNPLGAGSVDTHKGIYIKGPTGAEIGAVFPGRVDFSGWLKGYGQIIVVNHGSRFFTISAHLSNRYRKEGEMVDTGTIIGLLGDTGSLVEPRLYFEIRRGGANLDPLKWLKVN